jgi:hypothetical protein
MRLYSHAAPAALNQDFLAVCNTAGTGVQRVHPQASVLSFSEPGYVVVLRMGFRFSDEIGKAWMFLCMSLPWDRKLHPTKSL